MFKLVKVLVYKSHIFQRTYCQPVDFRLLPFNMSFLRLYKDKILTGTNKDMEEGRD